MCCHACRRYSSVLHKKRCPDLWASEALPKPVVLRAKYVPEKRVIMGRNRGFKFGALCADDIIVKPT